MGMRLLLKFLSNFSSSLLFFVKLPLLFLSNDSSFRMTLMMINHNVNGEDLHSLVQCLILVLV